MSSDRGTARRLGSGGRGGSAADASEDALDNLRQAFKARLIEDRARFVALRDALEARQVPPEAIIAELRNRAHKVRGGAAIFEMRDLAATACALEDAALAASCQVKQGESAIQGPLDALIDFLGRCASQD
jgi:HPt (histidine-containing phosphotransfer) domain-containing protein